MKLYAVFKLAPNRKRVLFIGMVLCEELASRWPFSDDMPREHLLSLIAENPPAGSRN